MAGGSLSGVVYTASDGLPLAAAHVVVGTSQFGAFTDANGRFTIKGIPAGKWKVVTTFVGFKPVEKSVTIRDGKETRLTISMEINALSAPEYEIVGQKTTGMVQESPIRMEVISPRLITENPGQSIVATLDQLSGINMQSTMGIFSGNTIVSLRGLSGNDQGRTLILIDDIPLNKADAGSVNWNLINRENIEKIEVIKGPGPAVYGSSAMGGVITIRTKKPEKVLGGTATVSYGTFNTAGVRYQAGGSVPLHRRIRSLFWSVNGFYRHSDGYNAEIPEYLAKSDTFHVNSYLREIATGIKTGYQFKPGHDIELSAGFFNDKRGRGMEVYEVDGAYDRHQTWQGNLKYRGKYRSWSWSLLAFGQRENFERLNENMNEGEYSLYKVDSRREDHGLNARTDLRAGKHQTLTAGAEYRYGSVYGQDIYYTSTDVITNQGKMDTWALFIQDELRFLDDKLNITAGLRFNTAVFHHGSFKIDDPSYAIQYLVDYQDSLFRRSWWNQWDPKLSAQFRFSPGSRIYLSVARGFRAPSLDDLCRTGRFRSGFKTANPSLYPEYLDNIEAGGDFGIMNIIDVSLSFYRSAGKNFMYYLSTGDTVNMGYKRTPVFTKQNISKVEITGVELDISANPTAWLSVNATYTFNHSVIREFIPHDTAVDKDLNGKFLTDVPAHKATAGLTIRHRLLNLNLVWKYSGKRYINDENKVDYYLKTDRYPAYHMVSARLWHVFKKNYTFAFNAENIFDTRFIDDRLQQNPGRMMNLEFSISF